MQMQVDTIGVGFYGCLSACYKASSFLNFDLLSELSFSFLNCHSSCVDS